MSCCPETADLNRLVNYLVLGSEGNSYQTGKKPIYFQQLTFIDKLILENQGPDVVKLIVDSGGDDGRYILDNHLRIYALVHCAISDHLPTKRVAYNALPLVCRTARDLLVYVYFSEQLSKVRRGTGWGRALRTAISKWYNKMSAKELATTCARFTSYKGWTHRDILRLAHVKALTREIAVVLAYLNKGFEAMQREFDIQEKETADIIAYIKSIHTLKHSQDEKEISFLIEHHGLHFEMIPTKMRKSPEVWRTIIPLIPLSKVLVHLKRFSKLGFLNSNDIVYSSILDQLKDHSKLSASNVHPVDVFLALKKYEDTSTCRNPTRTRPSTGGTFRTSKRRLNTAVVDALHNMFTASLQKCVPSLHKRFLVTVDVRNPMVHSKVQGCPQLTPALASAIIILSLLHTDDEVTVTAFSANEIKVLGLRKDMSLLEIAKRMRETPMGPVDCLNPLKWAKQNKKSYDAILILTDNQTKPVDSKLVDALTQYRLALAVSNARLFICALAVKRLNTINPDLNGIIEIGGFDSQVPRIFANFVQAPNWVLDVLIDRTIMSSQFSSRRASSKKGWFK